MKKLLFLVICLFFLLLCSCELMVAKPEKGKVHIVSYGNDYFSPVPYKTGVVPSLKGTVNDAVQMGQVCISLAEAAGQEYDATFIIGEKMTYQKVMPIKGLPVASSEKGKEVTIISDDLSTAQVKSVLSRYANDESVSDNDLFIFFYSGHGFYDNSIYEKVAYGESVSSLGYFCLVDSSASTPQLEFYRFSDFLDDISKIKGKKVVLADCCYSGCLVEADGFSVDGSLYPEVSKSFLGTVNVRPDIFVLASSQYFNESQDLGAHGEFVNLFLSALKWNESTDTPSLPKNDAGEVSLKDIPVVQNNRLTLDAIASYIRTCNYESYYSEKKQKVSITGGSQDFILFDFQ